MIHGRLGGWFEYRLASLAAVAANAGLGKEVERLTGRLRQFGHTQTEMNILIELGRLSEARALVREKGGSDSDRLVLSTLAMKLGEYEAAIGHLRAIPKKVSANFFDQDARIPVMLTMLLRATGRRDEADRVASTAMKAIYWSLDYEIENGAVFLCREAANLARRLKIPEAAEPFLDKFMELQNAMPLGSLNTNTAANYLNYAFVPDYYAACGSLKHLPQAVLRFKAAELESAVWEQRVMRNDLPPALANALVDLLDEQASPSQPDDFRSATTGARRERLRQAIHSLQPGMVPNADERDLSSKIQAQLDGETALVEFLGFEAEGHGDKAQRYYGALILTRAATAWVELGPAIPIDRMISRLRTLAGPVESDAAGKEREAALTELSRGLYDKLLAPIEAKLPGTARRLLLCPDEQLHFVSFGALLDERGDFYSQRRGITYLLSGRDLLKPASAAGPIAPSAVLVGNPDFQGKAASRPQETIAGTTADASRTFIKQALRDGLKEGPRGIEFIPLPGAAAEVADLDARFRKAGWQMQAMLGADASESALRAVRRPRVLHFATHGFYLSDSVKESMLRSGLALAGAQRTISAWTAGTAPPPENDGILTAAEATRLDLTGTQLVVLSACETALGEVTRGEGVLGLKRGFAVAGAENLLMTLWEIDDKDTAALMGAFYDRVLSGEHPADALHAAQREALVRLRKEHGLYRAINRAGPFVLNASTKIESR
jgi:CHAT domain-containing protein